MHVRSDDYYIKVNVPCWLKQTHTKRLNILGFQSFQFEEPTEKEESQFCLEIEESDS